MKFAALVLFLAAGCAHNSGPSVSSNHNIPTDKDVVENKPDAPLTANTHFAAGQVAESQGDLSRAIVQYQAAVKLDPTASVPLLRMGMIYTKMRQFDLAVNAWHRYINLTSTSASGYCNLGYTLELAQRFPDAEAAYKIAIAKESRNEAARVNYGLMLARLGKMDQAAEQLSVVLTPAEAHYDIASVLESQGKIEAARAQYAQALQLDPEMSDAKARLAASN